jgi:hypothetical protein
MDEGVSREVGRGEGVGEAGRANETRERPVAVVGRNVGRRPG